MAPFVLQPELPTTFMWPRPEAGANARTISEIEDVLQTALAGIVQNLRELAVSVSFVSSAGPPANLQNGMTWYDTTTHQFKGYANGAVVTFTTS